MGGVKTDRAVHEGRLDVNFLEQLTLHGLSEVKTPTPLGKVAGEIAEALESATKELRAYHRQLARHATAGGSEADKAAVLQEMLDQSAGLLDQIRETIQTDFR